MASALMPAPNFRKTSSTGIRVARITGLPAMTSGLISIRWWAMPEALQILRGRGDSAAGHHVDEVGAIFGAGVDVGVEAVILDRDVLDRIRAEGFRERRLHFRQPEHARAGASHRDPDAAARTRHVHADDRVARGRVAEFLVVARIRLREAHGGDDLVRCEHGLE